MELLYGFFVAKALNFLCEEPLMVVIFELLLKGVHQVLSLKFSVFFYFVVVVFSSFYRCDVNILGLLFLKLF